MYLIHTILYHLNLVPRFCDNNETIIEQNDTNANTTKATGTKKTKFYSIYFDLYPFYIIFAQQIETK